MSTALQTTKSLRIGQYAVDPVTMGQAVKMIVDENLADHIDRNFGCRKSTH